MQPSQWSEEAKQFPGIGDDPPRAREAISRFDYERQGEGTGPLRQYNSKPWLDRKKGTADLQSPAPYYTPFTYVGAHWHRWHVRPIDPSGFRGPKEFDERETKENDFYAESKASKWAGYIVEGSAWDDEWYLERTPQGYWADFFDPAWESMLRSAKIFDDENMPFWWQNRFRAMGFYIPLIFFFSRRIIRKVWRLETQLSLRTDGRRNPSFARRFYYSLTLKRRRKLGPKKRRRIGVLTWRRLFLGALLFIPIPYLVENIRRDTTPFAYAVAFGVVGAMFGPRSIYSSLACFTVGWFWGAGKEFVQRFEGATMSYIKRVEPLKNEYVREKVEALKAKMTPEDARKARVNRTAWLDEHKRDALGHPWASVKSGVWEDPFEDTHEMDLYPDYKWFRPALWRPYMWYIRPYEPVVPDPRLPFNPEDKEAFQAAHRPQAMANIVDRESLWQWIGLKENLNMPENNFPESDGWTNEDEFPDLDQEDMDDDEGPGTAFEMDQDEDMESAFDPELPAVLEPLLTTDELVKLQTWRQQQQQYDWQPAADLPGFSYHAMEPVDLDDPRLADYPATPEEFEENVLGEPDPVDFQLPEPGVEDHGRLLRIIS